MFLDKLCLFGLLYMIKISQFHCLCPIRASAGKQRQEKSQMPQIQREKQKIVNSFKDLGKFSLFFLSLFLLSQNQMRISGAV